MQLLYGNDGINYHTIAKSRELTDIQEKELLAGYLGYEFAKESGKYSSVEKEPVSITYVTTNLSKTLSEEKVLLSVSGRMRNYLTPSYWAHFQLFDMKQDTYGDRFPDMLRYSYITDTEVQEYLHKDIDTFKSGVRSQQIIDDNALEKEKVIVLVAAVLNVADSLSGQIKVVLDEEGDLYNRRALEVIASVYKYIPFNVRKTAGFCTYAKTEGNGSNRIKLLLYPRERKEKLDRDAIDLREMDIKRELARIPENLVELAREFVEADDAVRGSWFASFQSVFGLQSVSVEEHQTMFKNVRKWQKEPLEKIQDEIAVYAYREQTKQSQTLVYQLFCSIMNKRFREERYDLKYSRLLKETLEKQQSFRYSSQLLVYLALGEAVKDIQFEWQIFEEWEKRNILLPLQTQYEEEALIAQYKEQFLQLHKLNAGGEKFAKIRLMMETLIKEAVEEVYEEIKRRTLAERERLATALQTQTFLLDDVSRLETLYTGIRYKENYPVFGENLWMNMKRYLEQLPHFCSYKQYSDYAELIGKMQKYLQKDKCNELKGLSEQKGNVVKAMQQCRRIEWNHRNRILDSYQNIYMMRKLKQEAKAEAPEYELRIDQQHFCMDEECLMDLIQFLLCPSGHKSKAVGDVLQQKTGLMEALMHIEAFGAEHFPYLIRWCQDESMQEEMIKYYMSGSRLLSKEEVEEGLSGIDVHSLPSIPEEKGKLNIISISVREKVSKRASVAKDKEKPRKKRQIAVLSVSVFTVIVIAIVAVGVICIGRKKEQKVNDYERTTEETGAAGTGKMVEEP